jgi:hypothetical protein
MIIMLGMFFERLKSCRSGSSLKAKPTKQPNAKGGQSRERRHLPGSGSKARRTEIVVGRLADDDFDQDWRQERQADRFSTREITAALTIAEQEVERAL